MYAYICPDCGCYLDPGERCDCGEEREREKEKSAEILKMLKVEKSGQMKISLRRQYEVFKTLRFKK